MCECKRACMCDYDAEAEKVNIARMWQKERFCNEGLYFQERYMLDSLNMLTLPKASKDYYKIYCRCCEFAEALLWKNFKMDDVEKIVDIYFLTQVNKRFAQCTCALIEKQYNKIDMKEKKEHWLRRFFRPRHEK